ncbi:capsular polysaccharide biosynthesis protein CpsC [Propionigenium maris DSM 9537]|uniref:Capsular polysaccharide biosynthesis protein CpsC n=1 Tax=Propionigenium maris DSM 9537 TaxID=1123000 RepID=A0A9W6GMA6_9FUSO|nr:Wzz/FepE/Etk N-terminal domain-containing protein [Propionigenium maris]GLI56902.1 capsular polysaccharide biosynthesis protein CpsC [Propionigenium maris DSM 9537]
MKRSKRMYEEELYYDEGADEDEIELMDLVFILVRRWKLIGITTAGMAVLGVVFALVKPDVYTASTKLMISSGNYSARSLDKNELSLNQQLVTTYTEIAKNREVSMDIIRKFGLDMTPGAMAKKIKVSPVGDTEFIKIGYTDGEPRMAAMISNEIARAFVVRVREVMGTQNLKVVEQAETPIYPSGTSKKLIVAIAIVLGGMIGVFIAFGLEFFHNTIRKPEDIEGILGVSVIGSIPDFEDLEAREAKKNGKR